MSQIVKSILLVLLVSTTISLPFPEHFWGIFFGSIGIQVFLGWLVSSILFIIETNNTTNKQIPRLLEQIESYDNTLEDILTKNLVNVVCPSCKSPITIPISPTGDNTFQCLNCNETTRYDVTITPILLTTPVDANVVNAELFHQISDGIKET